MVWARCGKILFCGMHRFMISISSMRRCPNSMTQFNERKGYQGIRAVKNLSLKDQETTSDVLQSLRKKKNDMSDKSNIPTSEIILQNLPLILNLQMNG